MNSNVFIESLEALIDKRNYKNINYDSPIKEEITTGFFISEVKHLSIDSTSLRDKFPIGFNRNNTTDNRPVANNTNKGFNIDNLKEYFIINKKKQIQEAISKYKEQLKIYLQNFDYSSESLSMSENKISEVINIFSFEILGNILQGLTMENYDKVNILCGICQSLERFDLDEVNPWGPTLMVSMLSHKDENVKAYAIAAVDNWADRSLLPVLKNIDCSSDWLKSYVEDVISTLEV